MTKKIALLGSAPSSVRLAPFGNPEWEIWCCSPGCWATVTELGVKTDMWFEMHRWEPGQPWLSPEYCKFLENYEGTVIMSEVPESVKNGVVIPHKELVDKYGPYFFTSSLSWMFALAIEAGATTIGLWGVDMAATEEYGYQRAGCQYFAQLAKQMGIEVGVPPESDLLRPAPLYGVCEVSHGWIKLTARQRELQGRLDRANQQLALAQNEATFVKGAMDDLTWHQNTWFGSTDELNYTEPPLIQPPIPAIYETDKIVHPPIIKKKRKKKAKKAKA